MTAPAPLLEANPAAVERDILAAYESVSSFDADGTGAEADAPHEEFAALRRLGGVHRSTLQQVLTGANGPGGTSISTWHVVSFAAAERVLRDESTFSSSAYDDSMGRVIGRSFLQMDHQEHRTWRSILHSGFNQQAVLARRDRVRSAVVSRLGSLAGRGGGDLVRDVAFPVALTTIAELVGFPPGTRIGTLYAWAVGLLDDADGKIGTSVRECLETPSAWAPDSLVGLLLRSGNPAVGAGPDLLPAVRLLLSTGTEPPFRSLATLMYAVLTDREVLRLLREDDSSAPGVVQECWRWECPLTWVLRRCTAETEISGQPVGRGELVCVNLASANRDETRWSRPARFDAGRELPGLAMGTGPHTCLGRHLAMVESRELLAELLATESTWPPGYTVNTDGVAGRGFRSPRRLRIRF
ncbi:cytochrome P450 [Streptomyces sp. V4I2]|uniref:cytochrome P450 n=1 Tax=Streptomyces sp. V4I2 TaxID=3042280 RepID=UPI002782A363|nr:cytochrome P450 [Streptomyces sp. V4I2]MDQ1049648.1 cytochrome P450 [Streptomyces sp. V4I2]